jgi:hypothetical protein
MSMRAAKLSQTINNKENDVKNNRNGNFWNGNAVWYSSRVLLVALVALIASGIASAQDNTNLRFKGAIGVIPVTGVAANGTVNLNVVRGVNPGAPWKIAALEATVGTDGHIKVDGRGLLLAAGNNIGTNAGQTVHATLFCGPAATATGFNSPSAALDPDGDFRIDGYLDSTQPSVCESPVLLIRNPVGVWFAAGIQKLDDGN